MNCHKRLMLIGLFIAAVLVIIAPVGAQEITPRVLPFTSIASGIAISPDTRLVAAWDNGTGIEFAPDAAYLPVHIFDVVSGEEVAALDVPDYVAAAVFTTGGERFVALLANGDLIQWNLDDFSEISRTFTGLGGGIGGMIPTLRPDTVLIRTVSSPNIYLLYRLDDGSFERIISRRFETYAELQALRSESNGFFQLSDAAFALTPDGSTLVTFSQDGRLNLVNMDTLSRMRFEPSENTTMPSFPVTDINFTPSGAVVYYQNDDEMTYIIDPANGGVISELPYGAQAMAVSPDGSQIAYVDRRGGGVFLAPLAELGEPVQIGTVTGLRVGIISQIAFTNDGSQLIIGGLLAAPPGENAVLIFDL